MVEETCPWCEATLAVASQPLATEETCPQCLTTWAYEMTEDREAAIAA
jgi:Zn-finger nucleic acid-binding protein